MRIDLQSETFPCTGHDPCGYTHRRLTGGVLLVFNDGERLTEEMSDALDQVYNNVKETTDGLVGITYKTL